MRVGLIICCSLLMVVALTTVGCNSGGVQTSDEGSAKEREKYKAAVESKQAPTGGPLSDPQNMPKDYPGSDRHGQSAPQGGGQPTGKDLEKLYKQRG